MTSRYAVGRRPVPQPAQNQLRPASFPAPIRGWVANQNLSQQDKLSATVLENFFPTSTGIRARGGSLKYATLHASNPVVSMFNYIADGNAKLFAATATDVFDVSSISDADAIPTADISSQTSGYYSAQQFTTAGGSYLYAVNGDDDAQLYDGTSWQAVDGVSTPAITGVTTSNLSFVWAFAERLFFVEKGTLKAWYLPTDSIGGAAAEFSLAGIFKEGGSLLFGATWSVDAGDGLDDKCIFVSDLGEVAVYEGTNPGSAADWRKVGVYNITAPLGPKATMRAGGNLLVGTKDGIVPITEAIQKDIVALSLGSVSAAIEPAWESEVDTRGTLPWEIVKWPENNMMMVSQPMTSSADGSQMLVANLETGAWAKYTGWDTRCIAVHSGVGYFGTNDGKIFQMEASGSDDGEPYTCVFASNFDHLGSFGTSKTMVQAKPTFKSRNDFIPKLSASVDYGTDLPSPPNSPDDFTVDEWDVGLWDIAKWDSTTLVSTSSEWQSIGATGTSHSIQLQLTFGTTPAPFVELVQIDATYIQGGMVV